MSVLGRSLVIMVLLTAAGSRAAWAEEIKVSLIKPGAGFLSTDGVSIVPLEIAVTKSSEPIKSAKIAAKLGRITATKVLSKDRVGFYYALPKKAQEMNEVFDVSLTMPSGERAETFPVRIGPMQGPSLDLLVEPTVLDAASKEKKKITVAATAEGRALLGLSATVQPGTLGDFQVTPFDGSLRGLGSVQDLDIPVDQPSYLLFLTAAASSLGFTARASGVAIEALIRISVEISPGAVLSIEGASNTPERVTAPADGKTVVENVLVRYGAPVHAYSKKGNKRREVPIVIPTSLLPGTALGIPGQTVADGGVGPTVLIAVPPSPFGGEPIWPEVRIEGADIVTMTKIAPDVRALVVRRPDAPARATVMFDDQPAAQIDFQAMSGESLEIESAFAKNGERGAFEIRVKDVLGRLTDSPMPKARLSTGRDLKVERLGPGRYRGALEPGSEGAGADRAVVFAEIVLPEVLGGETMEPVRGSATIPLKGAGAPVAAETTKPEAVVSPPKPAGGESTSAKFGVALGAFAGTSFSSLGLVGGGILAELRLPILDQRLALRTGVQFSYVTQSGKVKYDPGGGAPVRDTDTKTQIAGFLIPLDFGFAVVHVEEFELLFRAGITARIESGGVEVGGAGPGANSRFGVGGTVGIDGDITVGDGAVVIGASLDGMGATTDGFSKNAAARAITLSGSLLNVRGEVGYRFWF